MEQPWHHPVGPQHTASHYGRQPARAPRPQCKPPRVDQARQLVHVGMLVIAVLAVLAVSTGFATTPSDRSQPTSDSDRPVTTRQTTFTIPFQVAQSSRPEQQPVEVQLFVSENRGGHWKLYGRVHPTGGSFRFRAEHDGEYWFTVRTLDRSGQSYPTGGYTPELKVQVDTTPPKLDLFVGVGLAGELRTQWEISDRQLDPESLTLQFQPSEDARWQQVAVDSHSRRLDHHTLVGNATWWPRTASRSIPIRAEVRDRAGNSMVVQRQVDLPQVAKLPRNMEIRGGFGRRTDGAIGWPAEPRDQAALSPQRSSPLPENLVADSLRRYPELTALPERSNFQQDSSGMTHERDSTGGISNGHLVNTESGRFERHRKNTLSKPPPKLQSPPQDAVASVMNTRRFNLDYHVDATGTMGVREVQLWGTRDGGRTWRKWSLDEDRQSPVTVLVEHDGTYGFRVVIENNQGLVGQPPQPGDAADIWLRVDLTAPRVTLTEARYGTGEDIGRLQIFWEAEDPNLIPQPITLQYRHSPQDNWSTITTGYPNSGRFDWLIDNRVPPTVYLRVEVRDAAGNVAADQLAEPVRLAPLIPKGRIRGITPLHDE